MSLSCGAGVHLPLHRRRGAWCSDWIAVDLRGGCQDHSPQCGHWYIIWRANFPAFLSFLTFFTMGSAWSWFSGLLALWAPGPRPLRDLAWSILRFFSQFRIVFSRKASSHVRSKSSSHVVCLYVFTEIVPSHLGSKRIQSTFCIWQSIACSHPCPCWASGGSCLPRTPWHVFKAFFSPIRIHPEPICIHYCSSGRFC